MGKAKYLKDVEALLKKSPVIDAASIARLVMSKKEVKQYQKQLVRNLAAKGRIKRLAKGCYTMHDDPSLAVFCFKPAYLGLQDALSVHELWEQETIPIIVTARKVRQGFRKILGMNVLVKRIKRKYIFGFHYEQHDKFYLPYSDVEKTPIDMIYFRESLNEEMKEGISKSLDKKKLQSYLKYYPAKFRKKVLKQGLGAQ